ncbi:MAG: 3-hydroxyacyl-CoA dehydrogenase/enoyl-CoA hydratase family protein [Acaryochloris sp. RU_4_1]|nr:3-hydroxyacyl-CoA dehydrogenase/enoyl-CoA hydratase family protein [Acaryochloris sp. RU_4_1]NJR54124.1 3-hydroxyacyl-CoA dehydrogenase/enoyl-CoA hydratase family protein [Acaryochloris sp. CRU_2_0]
MFKPFRTATVLGAGVMGAQIAAHLANAGLLVHLLDLAAPGDNKNQLVETAFAKARQLNPPIFFIQKTARRVILGNFDDHFDRVAEADWVIEAVVENLPIKQQLITRVAQLARPDAVISTNTSGLPIHEIVATLPVNFRQRFLGTHFFNPPRYLKLLELIPTADTDPQILERMRWFGQSYLGKGVVIAKDTPNFIANRIGIYATLLALRAYTDQDYTIAEIDTLTGTLVGRPKSATFRTADLVGLDTLLYVADNLYPAIADDESRDLFKAPPLLRHLVETGTLGAKTRQGFYKKVNGEILSLNLDTLAYETAKPLKLGNLQAIEKHKSLPERLQALYRESGRAGQFFRYFTLALLNYSAHRLPEIADSPHDIDQALRWGFGWELGPFEIWDVLGLTTVLEDMRAAGMSIPEWMLTLAETGATGVYRRDQAVYTPNHTYLPIPTPTDEIDLDPLKRDPQRTIWQNAESALLDMGDRIALFEFRSKGNTLSQKVVKGLDQALDILETQDYRGLVIGNSGQHFCAGANLLDMVILSQKDRLNVFADVTSGAMAHLLDKFQSLMHRLHYFPKPIVAAIQGRVLGGGCELVMACPHVVASVETYIGLVELSVGLIPGAGGIMRMATWAADQAATETPSHIQPFIKQAFETIGMAKVSSSAYEAQAWGYLPPQARIIINGDRRLFVAKEEVLRLDHAGYTPPPKRNAVMVLGRPGRALLENAAYLYQQGGYISEYDRFLAQRLAYVITGGDLSAPTLVSEDYLLQLERQLFLPLFSEKKTQERIMQVLKTKKPLRN